MESIELIKKHSINKTIFDNLNTKNNLNNLKL